MRRVDDEALAEEARAPRERPDSLPVRLCVPERWNPGIPEMKKLLLHTVHIFAREDRCPFWYAPHEVYV